MSFTSIEPATLAAAPLRTCRARLEYRLFEKAAKSAADIVFLDVEDAVAPDDKEQARKNIIQGLNEIDWGAKTMMVRINGLDTHYMYRDVVDVVEACPRLDMILIPKIGVAADVYAVDMLVTPDRGGEEAHEANRLRGADRDRPRHGQCRDHRPIEQAARGHVLRRGRLCRLDPSAHHGDRRGQRDSGVLTDKDAEGKREYFWTDPWHAAQTRMLVACRAYGLRPIDGPFGDFNDPDGFRAAANRAAVLGYEGKWAIHPVADRLVQRGLHPIRGGSHQGHAHHGGNGASGAGRARRRIARRPA